MNSLFEDIRNSDTFRDGLEPSMTHSMIDNFPSFDLVDLIVTISMIKPSEIISPADATDDKLRSDTPNDSFPMIYILAIAILFSCLVFCCFVFLIRRARKNKKEQQKNSKMIETDIQQTEIMRIDDFHTESDKAFVLEFLRDIDLIRYHSLFVQNGYASMKTIASIESKEQLQEIGVKNDEHCDLMMSAIKRLQREEDDEKEAADFIVSGDGDAMSGFVTPNPMMPMTDNHAYDLDESSMSISSEQGEFIVKGDDETPDVEESVININMNNDYDKYKRQVHSIGSIDEVMSYSIAPTATDEDDDFVIHGDDETPIQPDDDNVFSHYYGQ